MPENPLKRDNAPSINHKVSGKAVTQCVRSLARWQVRFQGGDHSQGISLRSCELEVLARGAVVMFGDKKFNFPIEIDWVGFQR